MVTFAIKNTFVHVEAFDDDDNDHHEGEEVTIASRQPPCKSAPGDVLHGSFHLRMQQAHSDEAVHIDVDLAAHGYGLQRLMRRLAAQKANRQVIAKQLASSSDAASDSSASGSTSCSLCAAADAPASIGAEGHRIGQCIPCLMQVRWMAGKCLEPCRFGSQCGRCHEPHTQEDLQKVQAKMRREKKRHGAAGAALLSAAFAKGKAAPIGAGAARMAMLKQGEAAFSS
mmetsp:Transcript_74005/g.154297  ORF Transcript_74005/g.154297 Transcript_74005/m.154297 type:complete len:227 (-) Transcript_74005:371-1051(-)